MGRRPSIGFRDANEPQFMKDLADAGWLSVQLFAKDFPDLICMKGGRKELVELKTEEGRVKRGQADMHRLLLLFGVEVRVVRSATEFLRAVGDIH
jgi:hypothetical protein